MKKLLAGVTFFALGLSAVLAKPLPSGTISVADGSQLYLGGVVTFDWSASNLNGSQNLRIQVVCTQNDEVVYGEAHNAMPQLGDPPFDGASFLLGGGSSPWLNETGGPAECAATLYYWDFHPSQTFVPLATVSFHAEGGP